MANGNTLDQVNGIDLNVLNETVSAVKNDPDLGKCKFRARNKWIRANHNCTTISDFYGAKQEMQHKQIFELHADEPPILAGQDEGANPVEHLLNALAACVTTSLVAHAAVKGIHIEELESELEGDLDLNGFLGLNPDVPKGYTNIRMKFKVKTDTKKLNLLKKLSEFSPVYNTITNGAKVDIDIEQK
ncbi:MAG: OsmC family protein [Acidobacteriota bacterium]